MVDYHAIVEMIRHDPLAVFGFLACGLSGVLYFRMLRRLVAVGVHIHAIRGMTFTVTVAYLRSRSRFGWSASLPYVTWATIGVGIAMLVAGVFRLAP